MAARTARPSSMVWDLPSGTACLPLRATAGLGATLAATAGHGLGRAISVVMWLAFPDPEMGFNRIRDESDSRTFRVLAPNS